MNNSYDFIIIGAGHNGLVAAAYLAKKGKKFWFSNAAPPWAVWRGGGTECSEDVEIDDRSGIKLGFFYKDFTFAQPRAHNDFIY